MLSTDFGSSFNADNKERPKQAKVKKGILQGDDNLVCLVRYGHDFER